jgi:hypothetical protein
MKNEYIEKYITMLKKSGDTEEIQKMIINKIYEDGFEDGKNETLAENNIGIYE